MILTLNGIQLNRCNIVGFSPQEVAKTFQMLKGKRKQIIAQYNWPLRISYDLVKSDDFDVIWNIYKTAAAISVEFEDWAGNEVSFMGTITPPNFSLQRILADGQWMIGQCTFSIDQLEE